MQRYLALLYIKLILSTSILNLGKYKRLMRTTNKLHYQHILKEYILILQRLTVSTSALKNVFKNLLDTEMC